MMCQIRYLDLLRRLLKNGFGLQSPDKRDKKQRSWRRPGPVPVTSFGADGINAAASAERKKARSLRADSTRAQEDRRELPEEGEEAGAGAEFFGIPR